MSENGSQKASGLVCVQYGCGLSAPDGWLSFDASPAMRLQRVPVLGALVPGVRFPRAARYGDVRGRLPVEDNSADCVYCSHVLEHLSLVDCRRALAESHRILKPGGVFRMVLPDLEALIERFNESDETDRAGAFMRDSHLGIETRPRGLQGMARAAIGNSAHLWMWEERSLASELRNAGFVNIRRAEMGDSGIESYSAVEVEHRWKDALGMHCSKPVSGEGLNEPHPTRGSDHV